jgi:hypothetical protein
LAHNTLGHQITRGRQSVITVSYCGPGPWHLPRSGPCPCLSEKKGHGSRLRRQRVLWLRFSRVGYHLPNGAKILGRKVIGAYVPGLEALGLNFLGKTLWGRTSVILNVPAVLLQNFKSQSALPQKLSPSDNLPKNILPQYFGPQSPMTCPRALCPRNFAPVTTCPKTAARRLSPLAIWYLNNQQVDQSMLIGLIRNA